VSVCLHERFKADAKVARLTSEMDTKLLRFMVDLRITCIDCGLPMLFEGLEPGLRFTGAAVSIDGEEAHLSIAPKGTVSSPLQRMAYGEFDG
jgi:hypothetical protein